jgi:methylated-DNA-[protein]-cysteine S-methyltransferase
MKAERKNLIETRLGWVIFISSSIGLKAVIGPGENHDLLVKQAEESFGRLKGRDDLLEEVAFKLDSYLNGEHITFDYKSDLFGYTNFQKQVWTALRQIPYGTLVTYGSLARSIGRPKSARPVGQAVGTNPLTIIVPCHRVVGSDGALTGFGQGLSVKEELLRLEGHNDAEEQRKRTESRKNFAPAKRSLGERKIWKNL